MLDGEITCCEISRNAQQRAPSHQAKELQEDEVIEEQRAVGKQRPPHVPQRFRLVHACREKHLYVSTSFCVKPAVLKVLFWVFLQQRTQNWDKITKIVTHSVSVTYRWNLVKTNYSPFVGDHLEPPQGPLEVPWLHFENHRITKKSITLNLSSVQTLATCLLWPS